MTAEQYVYIFVSFILLLFANCTGIRESQLYYEEAGSGETILFVHGAQEDYRVFLPQLETLGEYYHAVTYSRKYNYPNSNSYQPGETFNVFTEAEDLAIMIDALDTESVHIAGHSYGGLIAMAYAAQHPDKIKSLILSEPPLLRLPGCENWLDNAEIELIEKGKTAYETGDSTRVMSVIFEFFVGADIRDQVPPPVLETLYSNLPEMVAMFHSDDPFPNLTIDPGVPLLFITTGNTMPMLECTNEAFLQRYPDTNHVHLAEADHNLWMTHQEEMSGAVRNFLSSD
jgi:pimeloyl-ACP methyl ester carboxylesterase